jgi:nucleoside-diphosphate-sugar epimerase
MASVLLTGHRGYLGACVAELLERANIQLLTLPGRLQDVPKASLEVDRVIHCAGALRHRGDVVQQESHLDGTQALLAALVRPTPVVYVSSRSVYGALSGAIINEEAPLVPTDTYGAAKLAAETAIRESGHPYVILRSSTLIGFGMSVDGHSFLRQALHRLLAGGSVVRFTPNRGHDALDVWAAAQACMAVGLGDRWNETFNLAGTVRNMHVTIGLLATCCGLPNRVQDQQDNLAPWAILDARRFYRCYPQIRPREDAIIFQEWVARLGALAKGQPCPD